MKTKICTKCKKEISFPDGFYRDRSTRSGYSCQCKECNKSYQRSSEAIARRALLTARWRRENPEKIKQYSLKSKAKKRTPEAKAKEAAYRRIYLAKRRANDPAYREWKRKKNKEYRRSTKGRASRIRAKARRRAKGGRHKLTAESWEKILAAFDNKCAYCEHEDSLTADHFIPISKNGETVIGNIVPACVHCNSSKQDKMPQEWCSETLLKRVLGILNKL